MLFLEVSTELIKEILKSVYNEKKKKIAGVDQLF